MIHSFLESLIISFNTSLITWWTLQMSGFNYWAKNFFLLSISVNLLKEEKSIFYLKKRLKSKSFFSHSFHCANEEFVIFADDDKKSP